MVDLLGGMVADYAMGYAENYVMSVLQAYMWIIVLISIPLLAVAIAYCFFGIKIYRVLLVISGLFGGGIVGGLLLGLITESGGGAVVGFLLVGALMGALSWYIYKVFLFIQTFFFQFLCHVYADAGAHKESGDIYDHWHYCWNGSRCSDLYLHEAVCHDYDGIPWCRYDF